MKIAICDDAITDLKAMQELILAYEESRNTPIACSTFSSGVALIDSIQNGAKFDIIFMDILMSGLSGMEAAHELRTLDGRTQLVFNTVSPHFALEAFSVKARHYIVKPITKMALFVLLDDIGAELERDESAAIVVKSKNGMRTLRTDRLEYCEMMLRTIRCHMANGVTVECGGNMKDLEVRLLSFPMFLRPHRSFIVNMDYIAGMDGKIMTMTLDSGIRIPIPKAKFTEVRNAYTSYLQPGAEDGACK